MSNIIKWSSTTDREKTRLILEHVLGYFIVPDEYAQYGKLNLPKGRTLLAEHPDFHWPVAFWDDFLNYWQIRDIATDPVSFVPLRDLNDAWQLVERVTRSAQSMEEALRGAATQFMLRFNQADLWACTREEAANAICLAALRACGVEVDA